jgi:uncharacterized protein YukJ
MPLSSYGVFVGHPADRRREGGNDSPHYQIRLDGSGTTFRAAVNVLSAESPSELLYVVDDDLQHPITAAVASLDRGWHALPPRGGLDFIRANLFDRAAMRVLPPDASGPDNDLADVLDHYVQRAIADPDALVYVFGQSWGPDAAKDKIFGFKPGAGVHDVHMNQGNSPGFARDDGVWQDGGMLLRFPERWVGVFLAFQSQAWHTDDVTGHTIVVPEPGPGPGPSPEPGPVVEEPPVRILAALINPIGPAPEHETVLLLNASPQAVDVTGWRLADRMKATCPLPPGPLAPGAVLTVPVTNGMALGNKGGAITLLDKAGLKVTGVAYTADQAKREGWTVTF